MTNYLSSRNSFNILHFSDKHSQVFITVMMAVGLENSFNPKEKQLRLQQEEVKDL